MNIAHTAISFTFLEYLESCTTQPQACQIEYRQQDGNSIKITSPIVDLFSWQGKDYLLMDKGQLIQLDRLISVNETSPQLFC